MNILIINNDVDEGIEELKREAQEEKEKDDALAVAGAIAVLVGGERPDHRTAMRLLEKVMRVMKAEVGNRGFLQRYRSTCEFWIFIFGLIEAPKFVKGDGM